MTDEAELLERITSDPQIFGGKPVIRGMRIAVDHVLAMLAAGDTPEKIVDNYSPLKMADVQACLLYASDALGTMHMPPEGAGPLLEQRKREANLLAEIRREELRTFDFGAYRSEIAAMLERAVADGEVRTTSGLVEMRRKLTEVFGKQNPSASTPDAQSAG